MKPRIRYSKTMRAWVCFGLGFFQVGSTPRCAYRHWLTRFSDWEAAKAFLQAAA